MSNHSPEKLVKAIHRSTPRKYSADEKRRLARGFGYTSENAEDNLNAEQLTEMVSSLTK